MGCGASATQSHVWKCQYCSQQFPTYEVCEQHELQCALRPGAQTQAAPVVPAQGQPAQGQVIQVQAQPQVIKVQPAPAQPQQVSNQAYTNSGGGSGDLNEFLIGLGVKDVPKAAGALRECGIDTRSDFFNLDKDMRQELDEEMKKAKVSLGDRAKIKKAENSAVTVKQGNGEINVLVLKPGQAMQTPAKGLERVFLGLGWTERPGVGTMDVDASCIGFSLGNPTDTVFFGNLKNSSKSLAHTGDVLAGEKGKNLADLERIYVWLSNLPANIDCLVFVANVYTAGADFAKLGTAYIRMANADTNQEMARLTLSGSGLTGNALVFAKVYRCGPKGPWHFLTLGMPLSVPGCSSVHEMMPALQETGCAYSPPGATTPAQGGSAPAPAPTPGGPAPAPLATPSTPAVKPKKQQTPTGVYVAGGLAVATVAGVAAATAIFMTTDLSPGMFVPDVFENGVDFSSLVPNEDTITGIGEGIADGAGDAYDWAAGVTEDIPFDAIGESIGDAAGAVGDVAGDVGGFVADGAVGAVEAAPGAFEAVGGFAADAGGAVADGAGSAVEAAPGAFEAAGGFAADAGGAVAGGAGDVASGVGDFVGGFDMGSVADKVGKIGDMLGGMFG